jgi:glutamyl-tRNA synthetase
MKRLAHPVRLTATGNPNGPSLYHLLEVLGKEKTLGRIEGALQVF